MSEAAPGSGRDRGARWRGLALGGLGLGAVVMLVTGSRPWWRAAGTGVSVSFSGTDSTAGLAQALALVALAGALLGLVLRARGRRVLGVLLVLAGVGVVVVGLSRPRPSTGTVQSRVLEVSLADQFALVGTPWPYAYAAAGVLVVVAAALMTTTAGRWPARAGRFERATAPRPSPGELAPAQADPGRPPVAAAEADPAVLWRLLDAGVDPTATDAPGDADHTPQPSGPAGAKERPDPPGAAAGDE